jgi:hypothetical protein
MQGEYSEEGSDVKGSGGEARGKGGEGRSYGYGAGGRPEWEHFVVVVGLDRDVDLGWLGTCASEAGQGCGPWLAGDMRK